jgi:hypothetical protein
MYEYIKLLSMAREISAEDSTKFSPKLVFITSIGLIEAEEFVLPDKVESQKEAIEASKTSDNKWSILALTKMLGYLHDTDIEKVIGNSENVQRIILLKNVKIYTTTNNIYNMNEIAINETQIIGITLGDLNKQVNSN